MFTRRDIEETIMTKTITTKMTQQRQQHHHQKRTKLSALNSEVLFSFLFHQSLRKLTESLLCIFTKTTR